MKEKSIKNKFSRSTFQNIVTSVEHRKGQDVNRNIIEKDAKVMKFLAFLLRKNMDMSFRRIGRILHMNKGTAASWCKQVDSWPEAEKDAIITELFTGKSLPDRDAYDDEYKLRSYYETDGTGVLADD